MKQYIDKDAVVAEIVRRQNFHHKRGNQHDSCVEDVLYGILSYIDTLEVKEVDLEKEFDSFAYTLPRCNWRDGPFDKHFDDHKIIEARNHGETFVEL